jgi:hypothetical protein
VSWAGQLGPFASDLRVKLGDGLHVVGDESARPGPSAPPCAPGHQQLRDCPERETTLARATDTLLATLGPLEPRVYAIPGAVSEREFPRLSKMTLLARTKISRSTNPMTSTTTPNVAMMPPSVKA